MSRMTLDIVTAESETYSGGVDYVVAPGADGQMTILPSHAALMTSLVPGEMRFAVDGEEQLLSVSGGFMEVIDDHVTVLADAAERDDEIDLERAEAAIRRAEERIDSHATDVDMERAVASLRRGQWRVRVSRRRPAKVQSAAPRRN